MNNKINVISENMDSTVVCEYIPLERKDSSFQSEDQLEKELIRTLQEQAYEYINFNSEEELIQNFKYDYNSSEGGDEESYDFGDSYDDEEEDEDDLDDSEDEKDESPKKKKSKKKKKYKKRIKSIDKSFFFSIIV